MDNCIKRTQANSLIIFYVEGRWLNNAFIQSQTEAIDAIVTLSLQVSLTVDIQVKAT